MEEFEDSILAVLRQEKEEGEMAFAEMEVRKAQNLLEHADEIYARAPRQWIVGDKEKTETKGQEKPFSSMSCFVSLFLAVLARIASMIPDILLASCRVEQASLSRSGGSTVGRWQCQRQAATVSKAKARRRP